MTTPLYGVRGPVRAQDGAQAWLVVRQLEAPPGATPAALAVAECLTASGAAAHAQALNDAAARADALVLR